MKTNIKSTNIALTADISDYIYKKLDGLDRFIENVDSVVQAWVEVGIINKHHRSGRIYRTEIQIRLPGANPRAEEEAEDIFTAINGAVDIMERELKRYKTKQSIKQNKGSRLMKRLLKISPLARFYRKGRIRKEGS